MTKHLTKYMLMLIACAGVLAAPICHAGILDAWWRANDFCRKAVGTSEGRVISKSGQSADGLYTCSYKGIPYAAPPIGELRWAPPREPAKRSGVLYAFTYANDCPQCRIISDALTKSSSITQSEDCLYLNIWRPAKAGTFPVMVWIHGGALIIGSGANPVYDGTDLATRQDVVVVTINYRLGSLGYLSHEALVDEADGYGGGSAGNYGLLDQIAALKWVKNNIAAFGGDPDNVTIFGESAGAWSVFTLMSSPLAKGLFHKAIAQSGRSNASHPSDEAFATGERFASLVGCGNSNDTKRCLRSRPAQLLVAADIMMLDRNLQISDREETESFAFLPREDGSILPAQPFEVIRSGKHHPVPLMAGTTLRDRSILVESTHETLDNMSAVQQEDIFYYRFDYDAHYLGRLVGGLHTFEIPFVFNTLPEFILLYGLVDLYGPLQQQRARPLVNAVQGCWGNFAWSGNPNGEDHTGRRLESWPAFNPYSGKNRMVLDLPLYLTSDTN